MEAVGAALPELGLLDLQPVATPVAGPGDVHALPAGGLVVTPGQQLGPVECGSALVTGPTWSLILYSPVAWWLRVRPPC